MLRRWKKAEDDERAVVGPRITRALRDAGLSRDELASLIGEELDTVAVYEEGAPVPREPLELIAAATDKPLEWFLHGEEAAQPEPVPPPHWLAEWLDATGRQKVAAPPPEPDPSPPSQIAAEPAATAHEAAQPVEPTAKVEPTVEAPASARLAEAEAELTARVDELEQRERRLAEAEADLLERAKAVAGGQAEEHRRRAEAEAALEQRRQDVERAAEQRAAHEQELRAKREEQERAATTLQVSETRRSELDAELARRSAELEEREQRLAEAEAQLRERDEAVAASLAEERRRLGEEEARVSAARAAAVAGEQELQGCRKEVERERAGVEEELRGRRKQLEEEFLQQSLHQAAELSRRKLELRQLEQELALRQQRLDESDPATPRRGAA